MTQHCAIGKTPSNDPMWSTACPDCRESRLSYLREQLDDDLYRCDACGTLVKCRDRWNPKWGWYRTLIPIPFE